MSANTTLRVVTNLLSFVVGFNVSMCHGPMPFIKRCCGTLQPSFIKTSCRLVLSPGVDSTNILLI